MTQQQINRLITAAKAWAAFQEGDSLLDQDTDERLKGEAIEARERLLAAIESIEDARCTCSPVHPNRHGHCAQHG